MEVVFRPQCVCHSLFCVACVFCRYCIVSSAKCARSTSQEVTMPASPAAELAQRQASSGEHTVTRTSVVLARSMCPWQHRWIWTIPTCQTFARQWYPDGLARPSPRLPRPGAATRERTREGLCCSQSGDCALVYGSSNLSLPCCGSRGGMLWNACTNEAPFRLSRQCIEGPLPFLYFFPFFFAAAAFSSDSCIFAMAKPMLLSPPVMKSPARRRQHQDANGEYETDRVSNRLRT